MEHKLLINAEKDKPRAAVTLQDARKDSHGPVRLQVAELMSGGREAILEHAGQDYRLRITANGKLILTK